MLNILFILQVCVFTPRQEYKTPSVNVIGPKKERGKLPPFELSKWIKPGHKGEGEREILGDFPRKQKGNYSGLKRLL